MMANNYWLVDSGFDDETNQTATLDTNFSITSRMSHMSDYVFASLLVAVCKYFSFCPVRVTNGIEQSEFLHIKC